MNRFDKDRSLKRIQTILTELLTSESGDHRDSVEGELLHILQCIRPFLQVDFLGDKVLVLELAVFQHCEERVYVAVSNTMGSDDFKFPLRNSRHCDGGRLPDRKIYLNNAPTAPNTPNSTLTARIRSRRLEGDINSDAVGQRDQVVPCQFRALFGVHKSTGPKRDSFQQCYQFDESSSHS